MGLGRFFHSRRYIDRAPVDADGSLGITLLADHDLAAVHPNAKAGYDAELALILALLPSDSSKNCVDRPQDPVPSDRLAPVPQRNQTVTFVKIDLSAVIGYRL